MRPTVLAIVLSAAVMGVAAAPVAAVERWMTDAELRSAFSGRTLDGAYQSGRTFTETYRGDGRLRYRDDARASDGHWSVKSGTFCTIYDDDPSGGCFRVHREGGNCYEFYFVARTEEQAGHPRTPSWTARAWVSSDKNTCVDGANV